MNERRAIANSAKMKVRLALHARNLKSIHKFRPSSPYATVSNYTGDVRDAFILGQTEAIQFTSTPMWVTPKNNNQNDKEMGVARFDVGAILSSKTCMKAKRLEKGGWIFVRAEALTQDSPHYGLRHLPNDT